MDEQDKSVLAEGFNKVFAALSEREGEAGKLRESILDLGYKVEALKGAVSSVEKQLELHELYRVKDQFARLDTRCVESEKKQAETDKKLERFFFGLLSLAVTVVLLLAGALLNYFLRH